MIEDIDLAKSICELAVRLGDGAEIEVNDVPLRLEVQPDNPGYVGMVYVKFFSEGALVIESKWCGERDKLKWSFPEFGYIDTSVPCEGLDDFAIALCDALERKVRGFNAKGLEESAAALRKLGLTVHGAW